MFSHPLSYASQDMSNTIPKGKYEGYRFNCIIVIHESAGVEGGEGGGGGGGGAGGAGGGGAGGAGGGGAGGGGAGGGGEGEGSYSLSKRFTD